MLEKLIMKKNVKKGLIEVKNCGKLEVLGEEFISYKKKLSDRGIPFTGVILKTEDYLEALEKSTGKSLQEILENLVNFYQEKNMVRSAQSRKEAIEESIIFCRLVGGRRKLSASEKMAQEIAKKRGVKVPSPEYNEILEKIQELF